MKNNKIILLLVVLVSVMKVNAQSCIPSSLYEDLPFKMEEIKQTEFPANEANLAKYGGVSDGMTLNTDALTKAINDIAAKGGGKVTIPAGIWLTGPIVLKDNINLNLKAGAVLLFSNDLSLYPLVQTSHKSDTWRSQPPISGENLTNIAITGNGVIDGNGDAWRYVKKGKMTESQWKTLISSGGVLNDKKDEWFPSESSLKGRMLPYDQDVSHDRSKEELEKVKDWLRPVLISLVNCKNISLDGITFQNSPGWNIHPLMCENLVVNNITVRNPWYSQNGDGLDVESCKNVVVYNSRFDVGDDAICIKSGKNELGRKRAIPTENVIVNKCIVYHGHGGFVIGSEMSGGVKNIKVSECTFMGTDVGLRFKSVRGRGGIVENIWVSNINMINIPKEAIIFDLFYGNSANRNKAENEKYKADITTPQFKDIYLKNITCNGAETAMFIRGLAEMPVKNIEMENLTLTTTNAGYISDTENIKMKKVKIIAKDGEAFKVENSKNVTLDGKKL